MILHRFFIYFLIFFSFYSLSQGVERVEIEITTDEINRGLISKKASDEISRNFVKDFLGEDKFNSERSKIEKNIIKRKNRYILFTKIGASIDQGNGTYLTKVSFGLSKDNLQSLLVEHHLFYVSQGTSCVLPIVVFKTNLEKKESYSWWKTVGQEKNISKKLAAVFYSSLNQELIKSGFYSVDPVFSRTYESTPKLFLPKGNRTKDFMSLSEFLTCDIVLSGAVKVDRNQTDRSYMSELSFTVFNIQTRQKLFQFNKIISLTASDKTEDLEQKFKLKLLNIFNSITFQLSSYKDKGSLDLNRMIISVQGPLNYRQKERFKKYLLQNIPSIKSLQERLLASNKIIYEAEVSDTISKLVRDLKKQSRDKIFSIQVTGYNKKNLNIYVREK